MSAQDDGERGQMLIITGAIVAKPAFFADLLAESLAHVRRSRLEDGCRLHSVSIDAENQHRLTFLEHWADAEALQAHLRQPGSQTFLAALRHYAEQVEGMQIYRATPVALPHAAAPSPNA